MWQVWTKEYIISRVTRSFVLVQLVVQAAEVVGTKVCYGRQTISTFNDVKSNQAAL